jgi:hypothetical protein
LAIQLTRSEAEALGLLNNRGSIEIEIKEKKTKGGHRHGARGIPKPNKTTAFEGMEEKAREAVKTLSDYVLLLEYMDENKYQNLKAIKQTVFKTQSFMDIISPYLHSKGLPEGQRVNLAIELFRLSIDVIMNEIKDPIYRDYINESVVPLQYKLMSVSVYYHNLLALKYSMERKEKEKKGSSDGLG